MNKLRLLGIACITLFVVPVVLRNAAAFYAHLAVGLKARVGLYLFLNICGSRVQGVSLSVNTTISSPVTVLMS